MASNKKYGLILPDKTKPQKPVFHAARNVFGEDSDSDEEPNKKAILLHPNQNVKRQAKVAQDKALQEDPTVYQYDEIYEEMASAKDTKKEQKKEEKKPQYIEKLLKAANKRKIENERRIERQIQKEREKEGDEFADKEVFVTSAYKKKLEEMQLEEEKEKREEYLESIGDVRKQRDLGGFYRHLYEQKLGSSDKIPIDKKEATPSELSVKTPERSKSPGKPQNAAGTKGKKVNKSDSKRNYRKRKTSEVQERSEGEISDSDDEINRVNLKAIQNSKKMKDNDENIDADSDFSVDDPSSGEEELTQNKNVINIPDSVTDKKNLEKTDEKSLQPSIEKSKDKSVFKDKDHNEKYDKKKEKVKKEATPEPPKPKVDIWKKRTVGEVFEQALKRYYERKAARGL